LIDSLEHPINKNRITEIENTQKTLFDFEKIFFSLCLYYA